MDDSRALTKQAATVLLWLAARGVGCEPADPDAAFAAATPRTHPVAAPPAVRVRGAVEPGPVSEDVAPRPLREDLEGALAERINQARRLGADCGNQGVFPAAAALAPAPALTRAARAQGAEMARRGFFNHLDPEGLRARDRAAAQGFRGLVAENLAWGQATPEQVVGAWLQSPGHCSALMNRSYSRLGVGYAEGARGKPLWVLMLGEPVSGALSRSAASD